MSDGLSRELTNTEGGCTVLVVFVYSIVVASVADGSRDGIAYFFTVGKLSRVLCFNSFPVLFYGVYVFYRILLVRRFLLRRCVSDNENTFFSLSKMSFGDR